MARSQHYMVRSVAEAGGPVELELEFYVFARVPVVGAAQGALVLAVVLRRGCIHHHQSVAVRTCGFGVNPL